MSQDSTLEHDHVNLYNAAKSGNLEVVKNILNDHKTNAFKLLTLPLFEETPLLMAAGTGHFEVMEVILKAAGENVLELLKIKKRDRGDIHPEEFTVLHEVINGRGPECVKVVLNAIKQIPDGMLQMMQIQDFYGQTALHLAWQTEYAKMLLEVKGWANVKTKDGIQVIDIKDNDGDTALSLSHQRGREILQGEDLEMSDDENGEHTYYGLNAKLLWEHGADMNLSRHTGYNLKTKDYGKRVAPETLNMVLPRLIQRVKGIFQKVDFSTISMAPMVWYAARKVELGPKQNTDESISKKQRVTEARYDSEGVEDVLLAKFCAEYLDWLSEHAPPRLKSHVKEILSGVLTTLKTQYTLRKEDLRERPSRLYILTLMALNRRNKQKLVAGSARVPRRRGPALRL